MPKTKLLIDPLIEIHNDRCILHVPMPTRGIPLKEVKGKMELLRVIPGFEKVDAVDLRTAEWKKKVKLPRVYLPGFLSPPSGDPKKFRQPLVLRPTPGHEQRKLDRLMRRISRPGAKL